MPINVGELVSRYIEVDAILFQSDMRLVVGIKPSFTRHIMKEAQATIREMLSQQ